jgi:uroporphyrinogen decarboxylase
MNGYERIMTALERGEPDQVPVWELIINRPVIEALRGPMSYEDFAEAEDLDGVTIFENHRLEEVAPHRVRDEWGTLWGIEEPEVPYPVEGPIKTEEDLKDYVPPEPNTDYRVQNLEAAVRRFEDQRAVIFLSHDAFEFSAYLRGMENLLVDYVENPSLAHELAEMVIDYKSEVIGMAIDAGADAIVSGDDYAYRHAPLMSPRHFDEFVKPYLKRIVQQTHKAGIPFIKHTDGFIWPILDSILDCGIDALDPIEPIAGMDIGEVKAKIGHQAAVMGNVDCTHILPYGTTEEVVDAVKETIAKASVGGGHILASSNSIHPAVKPENYRTMLEAARRFGKYPLDETMVREYCTRNYIQRYL